MSVTPDWSIKHGNKYAYDKMGHDPYDDEDEEEDSEEQEEGPVHTDVGTDWSIIAARAVLGNLGDRRGIRRELEAVDNDVREEMVKTLAAIIAVAADKREEYTAMNFETVDY